MGVGVSVVSGQWSVVRAALGAAFRISRSGSASPLFTAVFWDPARSWRHAVLGDAEGQGALALAHHGAGNGPVFPAHRSFMKNRAAFPLSLRGPVVLARYRWLDSTPLASASPTFLRPRWLGTWGS